MKTSAEVREAITLLPQEALTKPILLDLTEQVESLLSSVAAAQEPPTHQPGFCGESTCEPCAVQAQELVSFGRDAGRESVQSDIDTALMWAGGPAWHDKVLGVVQQWLAAGRPPPGSAPALTSASVSESELNIALE